MTEVPLRNGFSMKTIYMIQTTNESEDDNFIMVIADSRIVQQGLNGWHIEQSSNKSYKPDVVFEVRGRININMQYIKETLEVQCKEEEGRFIIPFHEYNRLKEELKDPSESSDGDGESQEEEESHEARSQSSQEQFENAVQVTEVRKRGRPKGSRNKKRTAEESFDDDDQFNEEQKRGRGRPKGSKNKKQGYKKQEDQKDELKLLMQGYMKRGKGRPKGSKNKPKRRGQQGSQDNQNRDGTDPNTIFWKRGKGRPRGSKNKIKNVHTDNLASSLHDVKQKRNRGRPPGVKNKPRSDPSMSESSQNQNIGQIPELGQFQDKYEDCCNRCLASHQKRKLVKAAIVERSIEKARQLFEQNGIGNLSENFHPERRQNLFITAIKQNNAQLLQLLMTHQNLSTEYFKCCWDVSGVEQDRFNVKTKKEYLSKSGKEKIIGLLHDCVPKSTEVWWKQIDIERIMQNLPENCSKELIETFKRNDEALFYEMYINVSYCIRSGNYLASNMILANPPSKIEAQYYTRQHYDFLRNEFQLQFKKTNVLKKNNGSNYCSPIHCASVNPNGEILESLIKNTVNYNINDSHSRKPIHYAAACESSSTLEVLIKHGADVRDLDKSKMSPLIIACYYGRLNNVRFILEKCNEPLYVNHRSQQGYSALHYVVLKGYTEILKLLLNEPSTNLSSETREKQTALHLVAGTGNVEIFHLLFNKGLYIDAIDKFRRTPLMFTVRNHNHELFKEMLKQQPKLLKADSSGNTLLHYAAGYGNIFLVKYLLKFIKQVQNKQGFHPWDIAMGKGHLACASYLRNQGTVDGGELLSGQALQTLMLKNVIGTKEGLKVIKSMLNDYPVNYKVLDENQNSPLHVLCSLSEEEYLKQRSKEADNNRVLRIEFKNIFEQLIPILLSKGVEKDRENKSHQTALTISLENGNLVAMKQLLPNSIDLGYEASNGISMINFLAMLSSMGAAETKVVQDKLEKENKTTVVRALRGTNEDEPLLNFIKHFCSRVTVNYREDLEGYNQVNNEIRTKTFKKLLDHEDAFIRLLTFFESIGANFQIKSKLSYQCGWSIIHYLMQFPSVKILEFFKKFVKDLNILSIDGVSPLHLFCQINTKDSLIDSQLKNDYTGERSLKWLLDNGCQVDIVDKDNSSAMHYAALNKQISFIVILMQHEGKVNIINKNNKIPFIELIKLKDNFTYEEFDLLLAKGANPNFSDKNNRSPLHHLVSHSKNFDSSPRLCRLLDKYGAEINSLDEYNRTPLFYCFIEIEDEDSVIPGTAKGKKGKALLDEETNDKLEIVQTLINFQKINLQHTDIYGRTAIHYACEKNYFFSILYLLDKNINVSIQDNQGNTPLAVSLLSKNLNQAALLLKKGTAMGYVNENGKKMTYFSYALTNNLIEICHLLLDHGYPPEEALKEDVVKTNQAFKKIIIHKCKMNGINI